jgi:hypothetical protein
MARRGGALPTGSISWRTADDRRRLAGGNSGGGSGGGGGGGGGASAVLLDQDSSSARASRRGGGSAKGVHHGHGNSTSHNDHDNQDEGFRMWTADDEHKGRRGGSGSGGGGGTIRTLCAEDKARVARLVAQLDQETEVSAGRGLCMRLQTCSCIVFSSAYKNEADCPQRGDHAVTCLRMSVVSHLLPRRADRGGTSS